MIRHQKQTKNENAKEIYSNVGESSPKILHSNWEQAADDARLMIKAMQGKIRGLRRAVKTFEKCDKEGKPWPGSPEVFGQDRNLLGKS